MKLKKQARYLVTWLDHTTYGSSSWRLTRTVKKELTPIEIQTVGVLIKETKDYLLLSSTLTEDGDSRNEMLVLKGTILKIERLVCES
jgi:hypothetical protein